VVQVFLCFIWVALVLVILGLFFSKDILGDAPRIPSEPPRRAFKGEGSLTFTSPLKIPLCGGGLFGGGVIRRIIYMGAVVGFVLRRGSRIRRYPTVAVVYVGCVFSFSYVELATQRKS